MPNSKDLLNYESIDLIEWISLRYSSFLTEIDFTEKDTEPFLRINQILEQSLHNLAFNVIDIGGSGGFLYFITKQKYPTLNFNWIVVETVSMVKSLKYLQNSELTITTFDNLENVKPKNPIDLIVLNSSLQYFHNPWSILQLVLTYQSRFIYFGKTPLNFKSELTGVQLSKKTSHGPRFKNFEPPKKDDQLVLNDIAILEYSNFFDFLNSNYQTLFVEIEGYLIYSRYFFFKLLLKNKPINTFNILLKFNL